MSIIARPDDLRRQNRRRIIAALRRSGALSRTELSAATGLSHSTVTLITASLLDAGALVEADTGAGMLRRGRPQVGLALNPAFASVGVVALTLNQVSAACIDYAGNIGPEATRRIATLEMDEAGLRAATTGVLREAAARRPAPLGPMRHVALAVQGITDAGGSELLWSPVTPLKHVPLARWIASEFAIPATVANDCNMIAEALRWKEPEIYGENFAAILLSHGIGMGLYLQGRPFTGIHSSAAEFGHMCFNPHGALCRCGRRGCIEAYAGDYAIWRNATGKGADFLPHEDLDLPAMQKIAEAAKRGPGPEREAYRLAGEAIGAGLRSLFAMLDPFPVAFAGSGVLAFELVEPGMREALGTDASGIPGEAPQFRCYLDEFPLIRQGALMTALTHIDNHLVGFAETPPGSLAHALP